MTQTTYDEIINKLRNGNVVYLLNDFYNRAIKIYPNWTTYCTAKKKGGGEYQIKYNTDLVLETMEEAVEITEEEYLKY